MRIKNVIAAVLVTLLLAVFMWAAAVRLAAMIATGHPLMIAIAVAVALVLIAVLYAIYSEWRTAMTVSTMSREFERDGLLVVDDLPRSPGGRIDRTIADEQFVTIREQAQDNPNDPVALYNLAFAYDASGDRKRARATLRAAVKAYRRR